MAKTGGGVLIFASCCRWHNSSASCKPRLMRAEFNQVRIFSQSWFVSPPRWSGVSSERYRNIQDTRPSFFRTRARYCFTSSTSRGSCAWIQYCLISRRSYSPVRTTLITLNQIMPSGQRPRLCPGEAMVSVETPRSDPSDSFIAVQQAHCRQNAMETERVFRLELGPQERLSTSLTCIQFQHLRLICRSHGAVCRRCETNIASGMPAIARRQITFMGLVPFLPWFGPQPNADSNRDRTSPCAEPLRQTADAAAGGFKLRNVPRAGSNDNFRLSSRLHDFHAAQLWEAMK